MLSPLVLLKKIKACELFQAHSTHNTRPNIFWGMMFGKVIIQVFLLLYKKLGHLGHDKVPLSQDFLCLAMFSLATILLHFAHLTGKFLSRAGIVMLVQEKLSKIQVNCGETDSEITECIMIKSRYVTLSYSTMTHHFHIWK